MSGRHRGPSRRHPSAYRQFQRTRPGVRPRRHPQPRPRRPGRVRALELLRLRWPQRRPGSARCGTLIRMPVVISMLRGVNVGGHNMIKMDALRALYESLKLRHPQTYVQSGNVVFQTEAADLAKLARKIEDAIERQFAFRPPVILRTVPELRDVIADRKS